LFLVAASEEIGYDSLKSILRPDSRDSTGGYAMIRLDADRPATFCDGHTRRDFPPRRSHRSAGLTLAGLNRAKAAGPAKDNDVNCIMLFLVGGPSQLDTFDPKPNAPAEVRGPFTATKTNVVGTQISEIFPKTAKHADKSPSSARCITRPRPFTTTATR